MAPRGRWTAPVLTTLLLAAAALRLVPMLAWPSVSRPDEVFQALEPAQRLLTGWGMVSWEWREGIRSWLWPGVIAAVMAGARAAGLGTACTLGAVAATMTVLSLTSVGVAFYAGRQRAGLAGAVLVGALCAVWPDLAYYGPRSLAEVQGAHLLILAAGIAALIPRSTGRRENAVCAVVGMLLGLAFCLRFHLVPAQALVAVWRCRSRRASWLGLMAAASVPIAASGVLDWWSWGTPFQSVWKNYWINVVQGRSQHYGTEPVWWYFTSLAENWGLACMPLAAGFAFGVRRQPLFAAIAVTVIGSHMLLAHKEISFIFAALPAILIVSGVGWCDLVFVTTRRLRRPAAPALAAAAVAWVMVAAWLATEPQWQTRWAPSPTLWAEIKLRDRPDLCGLGFYELAWAGTGGYSYLNRSIPIALIDGPRELPLVEPSVNYIVAPAALTVPGFTVQACRFGVCLHRAAHACQSPVAFRTETDLLRRGE